jgi:cation diffusion facilitator CzcD-associated flavoprotein CzcO
VTSPESGDGAPSPQHGTGAGDGLSALQERLRYELLCLEAPNRPWVPPRHTRDGDEVLDVLIVGGGQSGLAVGWALRRERVDRVLIVDENPQGRAGPWLRFARMKTLRTPKELTGPDLGVPSLTFRAWYEAQHGAAGWQSLDLIPREQWAAYLDWYRRVLELPVQHDTCAGPLRYDAENGCLAIPLRHAGRERTVRARKVVLANGIDGAGAWIAPPQLTAHLPRAAWAHTHQDIDFAALRGKRIAVLGAGASAFDNALVALAHGARSVDLFFRRRKMVRIDAFRWSDFTGFLKHHHDLSDSDRYRFMAQIWRMGQLPPATTYHSAVQQRGFRMHPGTPWEATSLDGEQVVIRTPRGTFTADFLILATGFRTDLTLRPELSLLEPHIARWSDRFVPPAGEEMDDLLRHPYLGPSYEFLERVPGQVPYVSSVFAFNYGALLSHGFGAAGLTGFRYTVPRLVDGLTGQLYVEDREHHLRELTEFDEQDF